MAAQVKPVQGAKAGYSVFANAPKAGYADQFEGWNVDNVGMYWWKKQISVPLNDCDNRIETRELILASFLGRPVDLGVSPSGLGLLKSAQTERAACGILGRRTDGFALSARRDEKTVNALGRKLGWAAPR